MPKVLVTGINKRGNIARRNIPHTIFKPSGEAVKEWEVRHHTEHNIFDSTGKKIGSEKGRLLLDAKGNPVENKLITHFSKIQLLREMVRVRRKFRTAQKSNIKLAGKTITELMKLSGRDTTKAWELIQKSSFFRTALLFGELKIEPNYRLSVIQTMSTDYYLDKLNEYKNQRDNQLKRGAKKAQGAKQIILASR